jgi:hypothetical protein
LYTFYLVPSLIGDNYRIEGISETTDASADFYYQSNTNNLTRTSRAFYVKSLQVNHWQNTQKERARYYGMGRERERRDGGRGYSIGFIEDSYFWF